MPPIDPKSFWSKLRPIEELLKRQRQPAPQPVPVPVAPTTPTVGPLSMAEKEAIIRQAGRERKKIEIVYNGIRRIVWPLSFRGGPTDATGRGWPRRLFFAWEEWHNRTHSYFPEKIESVKMLDQHYTTPIGTRGVPLDIEF